MLNTTIKHSQTEMSLVYRCRLWILLFLLVRQLSYHYSSNFTAFFTCAFVDPAFFFFYSFQGIKQKHKVLEVLARFLLSRKTH